jgi:hypothetical protein
VVTLVGAAPGQGLAFDYGFILDELRGGTRDHVELQQIADTPVVYRAWGVWSFSHPAQRVGDVALDFGNYHGVFRHVYRCDRVSEPKRSVSPLGTWYVEGRAAVARVWSIGNIDTLRWTDAGELRFHATQNENRQMEAAWNKRESGWLNFRTHGVHLVAIVIPAGRDSCRLGIVAQGWVNRPMPQWLMRLAMRIVLPQLLRDLEAEVTLRTEEREKKNAPWYDRD